MSARISSRPDEAMMLTFLERINPGHGTILSVSRSLSCNRTARCPAYLSGDGVLVLHPHRPLLLGSRTRSINSSCGAAVNLPSSSKVILDFRISAMLYNTSGVDYACSPSQESSGCAYSLLILGENMVVPSSELKERMGLMAMNNT